MDKASRLGVKKILLIKLSSLGDILMLTPLMAHLKKVFPHAELTLLTESGAEPLVRNLPAIDRTVIFNKNEAVVSLPFRLCRFWRAIAAPIIQIRSEKYDMAIDLQGLAKSWIFLLRAKATIKIGKGRFVGVDYKLPHKRKLIRHAVPSYFELFEVLGIPLPSLSAMKLSFFYSREDMQRAKPHYKGRRSIVLAPFTRWKSKCWSLAQWAELGLLMAQKGYQSYIVGAASDKTASKNLADKIPDAISLAGVLSISELGAFLKLVDRVVCLDSLVMHLAAALGVVGVALFGPTDPLRTGPWGDTVAVLRGECAKMPCLQKRCFMRKKCINSVPVQKVVDALGL